MLIIATIMLNDILHTHTTDRSLHVSSQRLALAGERLGILSDGVLYMVHISDNGATRILNTIKNDWLPAPLTLSPSGRYIAIRDAIATRQIAIWDLDQGTQKVIVGAPLDRAYSVTTTFATINGQEILLQVERRYEFSAYMLEPMQPVFSVSCQKPHGFILDYLTPLLADQDTFFVIGHYDSDPADTLLRLSFQRLQAHPQYIQDLLTRRSTLYDQTYHLAAGPCGLDAAVFFRDPKADEEPGDYTPDELMADVEGFRGLYIRRLGDNQLIERIPYAGTVPSGTPLYATATQVLVVYPDHVDVVPRAHSGGTPHTLTGQTFALDPQHGRLARLMVDGQVDIFHLTNDI